MNKINPASEGISCSLLLLTYLVVSLLAYGCGGGGGSGGSSNNTSTTPNGSATLAWDAPTTNTDGTSLTDLVGYKIYYGTVSGKYSHVIDVGNLTNYKVENLTVGTTYFFVVTDYNTSGVESGFSNEVAKTVN
jgi:hypothetical protein